MELQIEAAAAPAGKAAPIRVSPEQLERRRRRQSLELARTRVERDLAAATHSGHRAALEAALVHLNQQIAALG